MHVHRGDHSEGIKGERQGESKWGHKALRNQQVAEDNEDYIFFTIQSNHELRASSNTRPSSSAPSSPVSTACSLHPQLTDYPKSHPSHINTVKNRPYPPTLTSSRASDPCPAHTSRNNRRYCTHYHWLETRKDGGSLGMVWRMRRTRGRGTVEGTGHLGIWHPRPGSLSPISGPI